MPEEIQASKEIEEQKKEYEWVKNFFVVRKKEIEEKDFTIVEKPPKDWEKGKIYSGNDDVFSISKYDYEKKAIVPGISISIMPDPVHVKRSGLSRFLLGGNDYKLIGLEYVIIIWCSELYPMAKEFAEAWEKKLREVNPISRVIIRRNF